MLSNNTWSSPVDQRVLDAEQLAAAQRMFPGLPIADEALPNSPDNGSTSAANDLWNSYYAAAPWRNRRSKGKRSTS
jgi:hypothetical protein